ncbi:MAG: hypothetical protein AABX16_00355 [Nanoarchaeota archaeon]
MEDVTYGNKDISGDEKYEVFSYYYNTTPFIVTALANNTLFASDNTTIIRRTFYFYDNQTEGVRIGDLTKIKNFNNGQDPETQYTYDSFGNVISQIEPLGYTTTYTYSIGTYKIREINAKGHTVNFNYDLGTVNLLSETRHGLNKSYEYDTFGRIKKEIISPDTTSFPTKNYSYSFDGIAPEIIKIETKNNDSSYMQDAFFYDGVGNIIQTKKLFNTNTSIVKNFFYDNKYRIREEQNPYFDFYSASLSDPLNGSKIKYTYDALDRVVNITKQNNKSILVNYNRSIVSQFDESNNQIDYQLDIYERIKKILEYNNGEVYNTTYNYRADDSLLNITDTKGNPFLFNYNLLGRKISFDDPNTDEWNYTYDLNGNLVNQTDGRNITTSITYDSLNRITLKSANSSNVSFVYDIQYNGTLTNITLDGSYFNIFYHQYTYDNRLRVNQENIFICYREVDPGTDECEWVNYTISYDSSNKITNMNYPHYNMSLSYNVIGKLQGVRYCLFNVRFI